MTTASQNQLLGALLAAIERREAVALLKITTAEGSFADLVGRQRLLWLCETRRPIGDWDVDGRLAGLIEQIDQDARQALIERRHRHLEYTRTDGSLKVFIEIQARPPHLMIVGAGHIAVPLAAIAKLNDFEVTVLDDRPQYAHKARFPTADRVIAGPFRAELNNLRLNGPEGSKGQKQPFDNHTYIVLVTRGHQHDVESLLEVIDDPVAYIGMIGSKRRIRAVFELLESEEGIPAEKFNRIYAPIGIDIGARTPAEIAVCIMAEMINVLRSGPAIGISRQIQQERRARREEASTERKAG